MEQNSKDSGFRQKDLPQNEVFDKKEIYQHPQPADQGLPLKERKKPGEDSRIDSEKEENQSSKEEGLNEEKSQGNAGAFEGFEDHAGEGD